MMRPGMLAAALLVALSMPTLPQTQTLEELIEGRFVGSGISRVRPGQAAHRTLCRFVGKRHDARHLSLAGRCAAADQTADMTMTFAVEEPSRRYAMRIEFRMSALQGYERAYDYRGVASQGGLVFTAPFTLDGMSYSSTLEVAIRAGAVTHIVETVEAIETGVKTVLIDLQVSRD